MKNEKEKMFKCGDTLIIPLNEMINKCISSIIINQSNVNFHLRLWEHLYGGNIDHNLIVFIIEHNFVRKQFNEKWK